MTDSIIDQYRGQETMDRVKSIAAGIFDRYGVDFAAARRAGGYSNATWIAGGLALRIAVKPGNENIRRDARLAALLPPEVGYPAVLETGVTDGYEWCVLKEIPGRCLGEVWDELSADERITALRGMWQKAQAVHTVSHASVAGLARTRAWFNSNNVPEAQASLAKLIQPGIFTPQQGDVLRAALDRFAQALSAADCVLNHGDLTLDNAMWSNGQVTALLDFEFSVIAPAELDLNTLSKYAFGPSADPDSPDQQRLRDAIADFAAPQIAHPGGPDLFLGYAILLELWMLQDWLAHPEGEGPFETWDPYRRLLSLSDGHGGYLAPILDRVG